MVCRHLASASALNLGWSGARGGASRGRVWLISPIASKNQGVSPHLTTALNIYRQLQLQVSATILNGRRTGANVTTTPYRKARVSCGFPVLATTTRGERRGCQSNTTGEERALCSIRSRAYCAAGLTAGHSDSQCSFRRFDCV